MDFRSNAFALAKQITLAKVNSSSATATRESGEDVVNFFIAVYNRLAELENQKP